MPIITPFAISAFLTSILSFALGLFVYLKDRGVVINRLWAATSLLVALWAIGLFGVVVSETVNTALLWQYLLDVAAIFLPVVFVHFVLVFLGLDSQKSRHYATVLKILYSLSLALGVLSFTIWFKKGVAPILDFPFWVVPGPLYFIFPIFFFSIFAYAYYLLLFRGYFHTEGVKKLQIGYILAAVTIGTVGGITNFLPQLVGVEPLGNYLVAFYVLIVAYAITRHHFLNLKVIATEFLVAAISIALLVNIFYGAVRASTLFSVLLFFVATILGFFVVRSVQQEVHIREQLEKIAKELEKANIELRKADESKTEFLSMASHQLRTPLTGWHSFLRNYL